MNATQSRIQEIAERCEKATPGPWRQCPHNKFRVEEENKCSGEPLCCSSKYADSGFIANSRSDIPFLLEQLTKAVEVIKQTEKLCSMILNSPPNTTIKGEIESFALELGHSDFLKEMRSDE